MRSFSPLHARGPQRPSEIFISKCGAVKTTEVFDTYWRFATERQDVFFKRIEGKGFPWSDDPIIKRHKFTNAYRASDRVSQYLIRNVIYNDRYPGTGKEVLFRILLFKLFNKIETWELLEKHVGTITYDGFDIERFDRILLNAKMRGTRIYSAAYIMPSGRSSFGFPLKHRNHLELVQTVMKEDLDKRISDCRNMKGAFLLLRGLPTIGDFLAYQLVTDINYSPLTSFEEMDFVMPGPGAKDGIRKCFADRGGYGEPDIIRYMADRQEAEFERLGLDFRDLWGRRLQLIDCQNLFCEVDKYSRVKHPDITGHSGRTRIKQIYHANDSGLEYWYPPKWDINKKIMQRSKEVSVKTSHTRKPVQEK